MTQPGGEYHHLAGRSLRGQAHGHDVIPGEDAHTGIEVGGAHGTAGIARSGQILGLAGQMEHHIPAYIHVHTGLGLCHALDLGICGHAEIRGNIAQDDRCGGDGWQALGHGRPHPGIEDLILPDVRKGLLLSGNGIQDLCVLLHIHHDLGIGSPFVVILQREAVVSQLSGLAPDLDGEALAPLHQRVGGLFRRAFFRTHLRPGGRTGQEQRRGKRRSEGRFQQFGLFQGLIPPYASFVFWTRGRRECSRALQIFRYAPAAGVRMPE